MILILDTIAFVKKIILKFMPTLEDIIIGIFSLTGGLFTIFIFYTIVMASPSPPNSTETLFIIFLGLISIGVGFLGGLIGILVGQVVSSNLKEGLKAIVRLNLLTKDEWKTHIEERKQERILIKELDSKRKAEAGALSFAQLQDGQLSLTKKEK